VCQYYDSSVDSAYTNFFYFKVAKGFMIYNIDLDNLQYNYALEISDNRMAVNYYNRFTPFNSSAMSEKDLIELLSAISYIFSVSTVIIFPTYESCSKIKNYYLNDVSLYNVDLHHYLLQGQLKYKNIKCNYDFTILDSLITDLDKNFFKDYPYLRYLCNTNSFIKFYTKIVEEYPELLYDLYKVLDIFTDFYYILNVKELRVYDFLEGNQEVTDNLNMEHTRNQRV